MLLCPPCPGLPLQTPSPFLPSPAPDLQVDLTQSSSSTLPFENGKQVRTIAVSPDGRLLLSIDGDGRALLINKKRRCGCRGA